jgi:hypothetical protein
MNTQAFGKCTWESMFFMAAGYDLNETPRAEKDPQYFNFFKSIGDVLPCVYCRRSYKAFFEELNMYKYFDKECGVMKFVYDLKNKVNDKLLDQEFKAAVERYNLLKDQDSSLSQKDLGHELRNLAKIFYTKDAPSFEEIVADYQKHQAKCSSKMKTCRKEGASPLGSHSVSKIITVPQSSYITNHERLPLTDTIRYSTGGAVKRKRKSSLRKRSKKRKSRSKSKKSARKR